MTISRIADAPLPAKEEAKDAAKEIVREAFFAGGFDVDDMIDRFFAEEDER